MKGHAEKTGFITAVRCSDRGDVEQKSLVGPGQIGYGEKFAQSLHDKEGVGISGGTGNDNGLIELNAWKCVNQPKTMDRFFSSGERDRTGKTDNAAKQKTK